MTKLFPLILAYNASNIKFKVIFCYIHTKNKKMNEHNQMSKLDNKYHKFNGLFSIQNINFF